MIQAFDNRKIQTGRDIRGTSQVDLARRVGVSQGLLSKWENGIGAPDQEQIAQLARALSLPDDFFYWDEYATAKFDFDFRKRATLPVKKGDQLNAIIEHIARGVSILLRGLDVRPAYDISSLRSGIDRENPKHAAQQLRIHIGNDSKPISSITEVIEAFGIVVIPLDLSDIIGPSFKKFDGVRIRSQKGPDTIFVNSLLPADRQRFTLAHELGHALLHDVPNDNTETEANKFASEFLIPSRELPRHIPSRPRLEDLLPAKRYWSVSVKALIQMLHHMGAIDPAKHKSLLVRYSQLGWNQGEPYTPQAEKNYLLPDTIRHYITTLHYSPSDLRKVVKVMESDWQSWYRVDLNQYQGMPRSKVFNLPSE